MASPSFPSGGFQEGEYAQELINGAVSASITELTKISEPSASDIASISGKVLEYMRTLKCLWNGRDIDQVLGILHLVREKRDLLTALPIVIVCITHIRTRLADAGVLHLHPSVFSEPRLVKVTPAISPGADVVETLLWSDQEKLQRLMMSVIKAFLDILEDVSFWLADLQHERWLHYLDMPAWAAETDEAEKVELVVEPLLTRTSSHEIAPVWPKERKIVFKRSAGAEEQILWDITIVWKHELLPRFIEFYTLKTSGETWHVDVKTSEMIAFIVSKFPKKEADDVHNFLRALREKLEKFSNPPIWKATDYGMIRMYPIKGAQGESTPVNEIEKHLLIEDQLRTIFREDEAIQSVSEADVSQDSAIHRVTTEQPTLDMKVTETGMSEGATWIFQELTNEKWIVISIADICSHLKIEKASQDREIAFFITEISQRCRTLWWSIVRRNEWLQIRS